jgi:hypothetical protein
LWRTSLPKRRANRDHASENESSGSLAMLAAIRRASSRGQRIDGDLFLQVLAATSANELTLRGGMACQLTPTHHGIPHVLTVDAASTYARALSTVIIVRAFRNSDCRCQYCQSKYKLAHDISSRARDCRRLRVLDLHPTRRATGAWLRQCPGFIMLPAPRW